MKDHWNVDVFLSMSQSHVNQYCISITTQTMNIMPPFTDQKTTTASTGLPWRLSNMLSVRLRRAKNFAPEVLSDTHIWDPRSFMKEETLPQTLFLPCNPILKSWLRILHRILQKVTWKLNWEDSMMKRQLLSTADTLRPFESSYHSTAGGCRLSELVAESRPAKPRSTWYYFAWTKTSSWSLDQEITSTM